jgi:CheY-like chemotaxis protein
MLMERILVVDDDASVRTVLRNILEHEGYDVMVAPNGKVAIELNRQKQADLVITDILMPEKDGVETIVELKEECPKTRLIAMSGGGHLDPEFYLQIAKTLGVTGIFRKPIEREELLALIRESVDEVPVRGL